MLDGEVVHLCVARERVEVERLQRRQPVAEELRIGAPAALPPTATSAATAPPPAMKRATTSRISSCGRPRISLRSGTELYFGAADGRIAGTVAGTALGELLGRRDLLAQEFRVVLVRGGDLLVRHAHPPRELRVVAVVEPNHSWSSREGCRSRRPPAGRELVHAQRVRARPAHTRFEPRLQILHVLDDRHDRRRRLL